jgi:hypothetical protein
VHFARNVDWLTYEPSLIVPSVRNLFICGRSTEEEALLLCCGLVHMGYKHRFKEGLWGGHVSSRQGPVRACMKAILDRLPRDVKVCISGGY